MKNTTVIKVATLHNLISEKAMLNHFNYARLRAVIGTEKVPCWQTLKNNHLIEKVGQTVLFEEGFEEEFVVVNTYKILF